MSLQNLFLFWVVAEQKGNEVRRFMYHSLVILHLAELNPYPRPSPRYSLFLCCPTNHLIYKMLVCMCMCNHVK